LPALRGDCPSPWGEALVKAHLKATPDDFHVVEVMGFEPSGEGEHLWLWVEKCGLNTDAVAADIAQRLGLSRNVVSYSGMKDRHARTQQWFSVHWPVGAGTVNAGVWSFSDAWLPADSPQAQYRVLKQARSNRKLRRGAHAANQFVITLRELTWLGSATREQLDARLATIASDGVPNYIGDQRFGHGGRNIDQGLQLLVDRRAGRARRRDQRESIWVSALRSALFNRVLAARVNNHSWASYLAGDVLQLDGRGSFFQPNDTDDTTWPERLRSGLIHPTGPMPGSGEAVVHEAVAALEAETLAPWQSVIDDLAALGVPGQRRALRLCAADLSAQWLSDDCLRLSFSLPCGAFATALLASSIALEESPHALFAE
jgi:tRNA pseudouridine13 synthase